MAMEGSGYEQNYLGLIKELKGLDFKEAAARLGLKCGESGAEAHFLGRAFRISESGVEPLDGGPSNPNYRSILIHYITSKGSGEPGGEFLSLKQLPGVPRSQAFDNEGSILNGPLYETFREGHGAFREAALSLGGEYLGAHPSGGRLWLFQVLPKLRLQVIFEEEDDEFPMRVRVLFDSHALEYMGFECLAFLHGCLVHALIEKKREGS